MLTDKLFRPAEPVRREWETFSGLEFLLIRTDIRAMNGAGSITAL